MTTKLEQSTRPWLTVTGCEASGGHRPVVTPVGTRCSVCEVVLPHHVTVTVGPLGRSVGRAWLDCTCGVSRAYPTRRAANVAALAHFGEVYGAEARDALIARAIAAGSNR